MIQKIKNKIKNRIYIRGKKTNGWMHAFCITNSFIKAKIRIIKSNLSLRFVLKEPMRKEEGRGRERQREREQKKNEI